MEQIQSHQKLQSQFLFSEIEKKLFLFVREKSTAKPRSRSRKRQNESNWCSRADSQASLISSVLSLIDCLFGKLVTTEPYIAQCLDLSEL